MLDSGTTIAPMSAGVSWLSRSFGARRSSPSNLFHPFLIIAYSAVTFDSYLQESTALCSRHIEHICRSGNLPSIFTHTPF